MARGNDFAWCSNDGRGSDFHSSFFCFMLLWLLKSGCRPKRRENEKENKERGKETKIIG